MALLLTCADARKIPLADNSVQCCVTSPPYWGLRKYAGEQELIWGGENDCEHGWQTTEEIIEIRTGLGLEKLGERYRGGGKKQSNVNRRQIPHGDGRPNDSYADSRVPYPAQPPSVQRSSCHCGAWRGAFGLEPTIEMYVAHTVEILREVRRVLRADGVCFWNLGDSYAANRSYQVTDNKHVDVGNTRGSKVPDGLKPKDLCLIPSRVALAAQADGWWVRSMIVWAKPNPMPESVTDRPTDAYEHIIMLTKSERYFWDQEAVREQTAGTAHSRGNGVTDGGPKARQRAAEGTFEGWADSTRQVLSSRNIRNVWTFATQPYSGAHFATFPEELPRRCILAATSTRGACLQCGAPWQRVTAKPERSVGNEYSGKNAAHADEQSPGRRMLLNLKSSREAGFGDSFAPAQTIGWKPTCLCKGQHGRTQPCLVLDPFGGSGTTGRVAIELRRRAILLDLAYSHDYGPLARKRTTNVQTEIFS